MAKAELDVSVLVFHAGWLRRRYTLRKRFDISWSRSEDVFRDVSRATLSLIGGSVTCLVSQANGHVDSLLRHYRLETSESLADLEKCRFHGQALEGSALSAALGVGMVAVAAQRAGRRVAVIERASDLGSIESP